MKEAVKQLASNVAVASIVDLQRLMAILNHWPEHQPPDHSAEEKFMRAIPEALGAAYFIKSMTPANYGA